MVRNVEDDVNPSGTELAKAPFLRKKNVKDTFRQSVNRFGVLIILYGTVSGLTTVQSYDKLLY